MGFFDFFKNADGQKATSGRCDRCVYCRKMPVLAGGGMQNVLVCDLSERDDGCVRSVRPDESCEKFRAN